MVLMNKEAVLSEGGAALPTRVSVADRELVEREPAATSCPRGVLALVGAWSDVSDADVDALVVDIYARRAAGSSRRVELAD